VTHREPTDDDIHPVLRGRSSPARFDVEHDLDRRDVDRLLEAARWAPSAGNSQPWSFVAASRGTDLHTILVACLAPSSARWAPGAALLVVNVAHQLVAGTDWQYSEFAEYDLGQAVAHMTVQAQAMGLASRQFRAFDLDAVTAALGISREWKVMTMTAIGRAAEHDSHPRHRRSLDDLRAAAVSGEADPR
jgi:nitroreductase